MSKINCYFCGGPLVFGPGEKTKVCKWCRHTNEKSEDTKSFDQLCNASEYRNDGMFEEASRIYDTMLGKNPYNYNALWGMVLCRYGVVYVERGNDERVITCRKRLEWDIYRDKDYNELLNISSKIPEDTAKRIMEDAKTISDIQKKIRDYGKYNCDIFLCYKETDEKGGRTKDSFIAEFLYSLLSASGYRVFFARETLKGKVGADYEALIFNAVKSAPIMIVLGTEKKYFTSTWVKNEWSRYLELIKEGENKTIIPLMVRDKHLPEELSRFEGIDMNTDMEHDYAQLLDNIDSWLHLGIVPGPQDPEPSINTDKLDSKVTEGCVLYDEGKIDKAISCLEMAASRDNDAAAYLLGCIYYNDKHDACKAFKHFYNAAELGNVDAMYQIGFMYEFGIGVKKNRENARKYYSYASEQGNYETPPGL